MKDTNLTMIKGDTCAFAVEIEGIEQDITNAYFSAKLDPTDADYAFQKRLGDGITKVEGTTSTYRVRIAPEDTKQLDISSYLYDLRIHINGDVFTVMRGKIKLEYEITEE